jgi:hypothetical protein
MSQNLLRRDMAKRRRVAHDDIYNDDKNEEW